MLSWKLELKAAGQTTADSNERRGCQLAPDFVDWRVMVLFEIIGSHDLLGKNCSLPSSTHGSCVLSLHCRNPGPLWRGSSPLIYPFHHLQGASFVRRCHTNRSDRPNSAPALRSPCLSVVGGFAKRGERRQLVPIRESGFGLWGPVGHP